MIEFYAAVALPLEELTPVLEQLDKAGALCTASSCKTQHVRLRFEKHQCPWP